MSFKADMEQFRNIVQNYHLGGAHCPRGMTHRKAYTKRSGTHVKASCIPSWGEPEKTAKMKRNIIKRQTKAAKLYSKEMRSIKCKKDEVLRMPTSVKSFTRESGSKVKGYSRKPSCVPEKGLHRKSRVPMSQRIVFGEPHPMRKYGYEDVSKMSLAERRASLKMAMKNKGSRWLIAHLTALGNLTHRTVPQFSKIVRADQKWVSKMYEKQKKSK